MSKIEAILIIIIAMLLIAYMSFMGYLIFNIYVNSKRSNEVNKKEKSNEESDLDIKSPFQTDFFNESAEHAQQILFNKIFIPEYGDPSYYGNKLMNIIGKLNDETKKKIIFAIKYMGIEANSARQSENLFRIIAEEKKVPVWFVILWEGGKKIIPEFFQEADIPIGENKIVSLYKAA